MKPLAPASTILFEIVTFSVLQQLVVEMTRVLVDDADDGCDDRDSDVLTLHVVVPSLGEHNPRPRKREVEATDTHGHSTRAHQKRSTEDGRC